VVKYKLKYKTITIAYKMSRLYAPRVGFWRCLAIPVRL